MDVRSFMLMTVVGCLGWSAVLVYAGYLAGRAWNSVFTSSQTLVDALSAIAVTLAAIYIAYYAYGWMGKAPSAPRLQP